MKKFIHINGDRVLNFHERPSVWYKKHGMDVMIYSLFSDSPEQECHTVEGLEYIGWRLA